MHIFKFLLSFIKLHAREIFLPFFHEIEKKNVSHVPL